jgi:protein-tyrosine phosphatase
LTVIDIHCHILPGIDDGPQHIDESLEMAKIASLDGITTIVATPHIKEPPYPSEDIETKVAVLNDRLTEKGIPVTVLQGADVSSTVDVSLLHGYTINKTRYILIEFPHLYLPGNAKEIIFRLMMHGYRPIITHPERNLSILENPKLFLELLDTGLLVQITADSLTGAFGLDIRECASYFLKKGVVNFIATDGHSSRERRPELSGAVRTASRIIGKEQADRLVTLNPGNVVQGKAIGA